RLRPPHPGRLLEARRGPEPPRPAGVDVGLAPFLALLIPLLGGGEGPEGRAAAGQEDPGGARRTSWGFETTGAGGRELYAMEDVPILLGGRPTHPDWTEEFGAGADPAE